MTGEPRSGRLKRERDMAEDDRRDGWHDRFDSDSVAEKWAREDERPTGYAERPEWRGNG